MKRWYLTLLIGAVLAGMGASGLWYVTQNQLSTRAAMGDPEILRMLAVLEGYRNADLKVSFSGYEYPPEMMIRKSRELIRKRFKPGTRAEDWVRERVWRTDKGDIIYFIYPDGRQELARDVLLKDLATTPPQK